MNSEGLVAQEKQREWLDQWRTFQDDELFLFQDWIHPNGLDTFQGKTVLEAGCGGGQHSSFVAKYCEKLVAVDLNSVEVAKSRNREYTNITFLEEDIATMDLEIRFDLVFSVGVVHHTDNPDRTVRNLIRHLKPGGRLILWVYSKEGNWISEHVVERFRKRFLQSRSTLGLVRISRAITGLMYIPIYTLYYLPMRFLPYYEYFQNFRKLSYERNVLNVFDKLNAPQVQFIEERRVRDWLSSHTFSDVSITRYRGVSWRISATLLGPESDGNGNSYTKE